MSKIVFVANKTKNWLNGVLKIVYKLNLDLNSVNFVEKNDLMSYNNNERNGEYACFVGLDQKSYKEILKLRIYEPNLDCFYIEGKKLKDLKEFINENKL